MKIIDEADIFSRAKEHKVVYKVTLNEEKIVLRIFTVKLRANMIYMEIDKLGLLRVVYVTRRYENPIIIACKNICLFGSFPT